MPELCLIKGAVSSSYAALTPAGSPLQPENNQDYLHINPEHLATLLHQERKGKKGKFPIS